MADQTSTLSIEVRTGQSVAELNKLKTSLAAVAAMAAKVSSTAIVPSSIIKNVQAASAGIKQYSSAMDTLQEAGTKAAGSQNTLDKPVTASGLFDAAELAKQGGQTALSQPPIVGVNAGIILLTGAPPGLTEGVGQAKDSDKKPKDDPSLEGLNKLSEKYRKEAEETGGIVAGSLEVAFGRARAALETFVLTGKFNFRDFTASVLQDLSKLALKMATNQLFGMIIQMGISAVKSFTAPDTSYADATYGDVQFSAKGNAFNSGKMMKFATGGAFTNNITTGTNLAPMSMFGEAGPEAIMPLTRTSNGDLGVRAVPIGAQSSGGNVYYMTTNVNVASDGSASSETKSDNALLAQFGSQLNEMIKGAIRKETGQGGLIRQALKAA